MTEDLGTWSNIDIVSNNRFFCYIYTRMNNSITPNFNRLIYNNTSVMC